MLKVTDKEQIVNEIKEKISGAKSLVVIDARGLTVLQDTNLRKQFREVGVEYKVYKNTLCIRAVKDTPFEGLADHLKGPSAFAFSYDDATKAARIINKNMKDMKVLEFKAGCIDGTVFDAKTIEAISNIPSKEELLSKLLGSLKSPIGSFARVVQAIADKNNETETA